MENVAGEQGLALQQLFHTNLILIRILLKLQTVIKSHSLKMGASDLHILIFSICFFHFWHLLFYNP